MKITDQTVHNIISKAKQTFTDQPCRLYWGTERGAKELTYEEKRIVALLEAMGTELKLNLEIEYGKQ